MQPTVQLQVNVLGEATGADTALKRPGARVQAQVGLEVAGAAEALVAYLMGMGIGISSAHTTGSGSLLPLPHPLPVIQAWKPPIPPRIPPWTHSVWHIGSRQTWVSILVLLHPA